MPEELEPDEMKTPDTPEPDKKKSTPPSLSQAYTRPTTILMEPCGLPELYIRTPRIFRLLMWMKRVNLTAWKSSLTCTAHRI